MIGTRIPLADAEYLQLIGQATYMAAYVEWTILGDLTPLSRYLPHELSIVNLAGKPMGVIGDRINSQLNSIQDPDVCAYLKQGAQCLKEISGRRNHLLHARPATVSGAQLLYRWREGEGNQFAITYEWLEETIAFIDERGSVLQRYREPTLSKHSL